MSINQVFAVFYLPVFIGVFCVVAAICSRYVVKLDESRTVVINKKRLRRLLAVYLVLWILVCIFFPMSAAVTGWDSLSVAIESVNRNRLAYFYRTKITDKLFPEIMAENTWCSAATYAEHTQRMLYRKHTCRTSTDACANSAMELYNGLYREHFAGRPNEGGWVIDYTIAQNTLVPMIFVNRDSVRVLSVVGRAEGLITKPETLNDASNYPNVLDTAHFLDAWKNLPHTCSYRSETGWAMNLQQPLTTSVSQQTSLR